GLVDLLAYFTMHSITSSFNCANTAPSGEWVASVYRIKPRSSRRCAKIGLRLVNSLILQRPLAALPSIQISLLALTICKEEQLI
ncbi:12989_t:CDS:1, partial [Gigaspora rosea]